MHTNNQTPEDITALFAKAGTHFTTITGNLSDNNLTHMCEILMSLLLDIPFEESGAHPQHNLFGLIKPMVTYTNKWGAAFLCPARPASYDPAIATNATLVTHACMEAMHTVRLQDYTSYTSYKMAKHGTSKFIHDAVDEL